MELQQRNDKGYLRSRFKPLRPVTIHYTMDVSATNTVASDDISYIHSGESLE